MRNSLVAQLGALGILIGAGTAAMAATIPWPILSWRKFDQLGIAAYLPVALEYEEREKDLGAGVPPGLYYQLGATFLSFVSETQGALRLQGEYEKDRGTAPIAGALPDDVRPKDAVHAILSAARTRKFVLLNEEHLTSIHRAFMNRLLRGLRDAGFTHLAMEALAEDGDTLRARGYPTAKSGSYILDPLYGDMVRRAVALGFEIVSYDPPAAALLPASQDPAGNSRDRMEAENIVARTIARNPRARVVVFGGRSHIAKKGGLSDGKDQYVPMGEVLGALSGSEPLSVDMVTMTQHPDPALDSQAYLEAYARGLMRRSPQVLVNSKGKFFSLSDSYDMMVFFPRTRMRSGRADWAAMGGIRRAVDPHLRLSVDQPLLVQARLHGESNTAIPVDQVIYRPGKARPVLLLRPGDYEVRAVDRAGGVRLSRRMRINF